jgi:MFS family permease
MDNKPMRYKNHLAVAIVMLLFGTSIATAQYKVPSIMPAIMEQLSLDANAASWLMSIFTFVGIILALPTGVMVKKFGPKNMLLAGGGIMVIGSLIGAFSQAPAMLITSRGIEGIALIFTTICGPLAVQKYVAPEKIGSATGIWALWVCLGSELGGTLTPALYRMTGFTGVWIIYAAAAAVTALVLFAFLKEPGQPILNDIADATTEANAQRDSEQKASYAALFKPNTLLFMAGFMIFNLVLLAMLAFAPTFMQINGVDPTLSGFVSTLPMLLAIISSPLFGYLADKTGNTKLLITLAMIVMGPCAFIMLTNVGILMWVAAIVMGLIGLGGPVMFLVSLGIVVGKPELMAIAMGFLMLIQSLGQFLGTALTPLLLGADLSNWTFTGIVIMIIGFVGALCVFVVNYKKA